MKQAQLFPFPPRLRALFQEFPSQNIGQALASLSYERQHEIIRAYHDTILATCEALVQEGRAEEAMRLSLLPGNLASILTDLGTLSELYRHR
jgi:hypothetical protein